MPMSVDSKFNEATESIEECRDMIKLTILKYEKCVKNYESLSKAMQNEAGSFTSFQHEICLNNRPN
jgi:predicted DNA-binding ArsR family transcriptional regulator